MRHANSYQKDKKNNSFFRQYYYLAFSLVNKQISNVDDVEDIVQNVFAKFYEKQKEILNPKAWITGACYYEVFNFLRKKNPFININSIPLHETAEIENVSEETKIIINDILTTIEEEDKIILDMIATHNIPFTRTAEVLGLTIRRIRYRYDLLESKIRDSLKKYGITNIDDLL